MTKDDPLSDEPFSYRKSKDGLVRISYAGKVVTTLAAASAARFLARVESGDAKVAQLAMSKATGHFKHGNERMSKDGG